MRKFWKRASALLLGGLMLGGVAVMSACNSEEESNIGFMVEVTVDEGRTIFEPTGTWGYRYGPAMMYNQDGLMEIYYSGPPETGREWDDLFYWTSGDYG